MRIFLFALFLALAGAISGCATVDRGQTRADTPSGLPELLFQRASKRDVISKIVASRVAAGMRPKAVTDSMVVVAKLADGDFLASFLYGSRYDSTPELRVTYTITESTAGVMVYSRAEVVTNPNSAYERPNDITHHMANRMQGELVRIKGELGG